MSNIRATIKDRLDDTFTPINFIRILKEKKKSLGIILNRGSIPQHMVFHSKNFVELLANIRLSKRIQTRRIRIAIDEEGVFSYEKKLYEISGEKFQAAWKFGDWSYCALEQQEITVDNGRRDLVINLGSYSEISQMIKNPINKNIYQWISNGLFFNENIFLQSDQNLSLKDKSALKKFTANFICLILCCETQRNPSNLIMQIILIDLVINTQIEDLQDIFSKKEYEKFCSGGEMPMSMSSYSIENVKTPVESSPVQCARVLQKHYGFFSIKKWAYEGPLANESEKSRESTHIKELVKREYALVDKWLKFKQLEQAPEDSKIKAISELSKSYLKK